MTDEDIRTAILDQLTWDNRIEHANIHVQVTNGEVTLTGSVPTHTVRLAAEKDASQVTGVKVVNDRTGIEFPGALEIPKDEAIKEYILDRFQWNPDLEFNEINVEVSDGSIRLGGKVDSYWKKMKAKDLAYDVRGVRYVENKINVIPEEVYDDHIIAENIISGITRIAAADPEKIDLNVNDGFVKAEGYVRNPVELGEVLHIIRHTRSVKDIESKLQVEQNA